MFESKPKQVTGAPDVLLQEIEGEAVLLNLTNGKYYGLNENSYHMYKTLLSCDSIQAAYESLLGEYDVPPDRLRADLDQFIAHLVENGLLIDDSNKPE